MGHLELSEFKDRLSAAMESKGINARQLGLAVGTNPTNITRYLAGREPKITVIPKIAEALDTTVEYLLTGVSQAEPPKLENVTLIKFRAAEASLGTGSYIDEAHVIGEHAFPTEWLKGAGLDPENLSLIRAKGDSMEPTIKDGDTLLIDHSAATPQSDAIYVFNLDGGLVAKTVQRLFGGGILIKSDNQKYQEQKLTDDEAEALHVVGRVVWIGRLV